MDDTRFSAAFGLREAAEIAVAPYCHSARVNRAVAADPSLKTAFAQADARRKAAAQRLATREDEARHNPIRTFDTVRLAFPYEGLGTATILSVRRGICGVDYELDLPDPHSSAATWFVPRDRFTRT